MKNMSLKASRRRDELKKFIKEVQKAAAFDGCWCRKLSEENETKGEKALYLVFAHDEEAGLIGKVAYNCDDLQCDYDWDWMMPTDEDGNVFGWEGAHCEKMNAEEIADDVLETLAA